MSRRVVIHSGFVFMHVTLTLNYTTLYTRYIHRQALCYHLQEHTQSVTLHYRTDIITIAYIIFKMEAVEINTTFLYRHHHHHQQQPVSYTHLDVYKRQGCMFNVYSIHEGKQKVRYNSSSLSLIHI